MAKMLKQLVFGQKKNPPAPPQPDYEGDKLPVVESEAQSDAPFFDHDYENLPKFRYKGGNRVQFAEKKEPELVVFDNYSEPADLRAELAALEADPLYISPLDADEGCAPPLEEDMYCVPYDTPEDEHTPPPLPHPCLGQVPPQRRRIVAAAFSALLYVMAIGMVSSYSAPASVDMLRRGSRFRSITPNEVTWIASLPLLTGVFGNAFSGYASHKLGRKTVLMYISVPYVLGWLMIAYAPTVGFIFAGRMITGFVAGMSIVAVPAYIVEISTVDIRGFLTACFQVAFALGVLLVMGLGSVLRWSWLAVSGAGLILLAAILMCFMPESPHWLARQSRNVEAIWALKFLKGKQYDALSEVREIHELMADESNTGVSWREILNPALYKPVLIALAFMLFQQFSGFNVLVSYAVELIQETKINFDASYATILVSVIQLCMTVVSSLLMDRAGRKPLFIFSGSLMTASLISLGVYSYFTRESSSAELTHLSWIPLLSYAVFIAAYSLGYGSIPYVMTPELVSTKFRSFVMAIACVTGSFFGFLITKVFDDMRNSMGLSGCYWFYSIFAFSGCLFCWFAVPETKGRALHEIHQSLSSPKRSVGR